MNNFDPNKCKEFLLRDGDLVVRPLNDRPADYFVMFNWLQNPKVREFYLGRSQPQSIASIQDEYAPEIMIKECKVPCIIEFLQRPVGYLQVSALQPAEYLAYGYSQDEFIFGIDVFIGETELWGCGLGRRAIACTRNYLLTALGADRVVDDPWVDNLRAIHSYIGAGFHKVKILPRHKLHKGVRVDCWLMEAVREEVSPTSGMNPF